jgi:hypothetical protein
VVKNYCDAALRIYQMMKYFALEAKKQEDIPIDYSTEFYNRFDEYYKDFKFIRYYDAIRNFITKKPSNEDKIKLNFEKPGLLEGFVESPIGNAQYCGYILRKNNKYYLGVSLYTHFLDVQKYKLNEIDGEDFYEKLEYYSLDWSKNIVGGRVYESFTKFKFGKPISYQEHKNEFKDHPKKHVEIIKELIKEKYLERYPQLKQIIEKDFDTPKEMQKAFNDLNLKGFYWIKVKSSHIDNQEIIEYKGKHEKRYFLYLFEISNKDFIWPNQKKNIHTLYFLNLFSDKNIQKPVFRLGANAEVFYRPASVKKEIDKGRSKEGKEIIKYKRYTEDKIFLHLPIEINYGCPKAPNKNQYNKKIIEFLNKNKDEINIIGIDRGEKNLLYYTVINQKGEIVDHGSLNEINKVNYLEKLIEREKERQINRQSWEPVAKIKDLKKGYLSYVVRKIADLVEKYNAIIVLEDLNMRFKQVRGGIERSIYQQFEKQLIDKLGYLVFKDDRDPESPGGVLNGYQLVAPFNTFKDLGKQTGIIFYTNAEYTSKTDPITGYRKHISNTASQKKIKENLINKLEAVGWDQKEQSYFFSYNQKDFSYNQKDFDSPVSKEWTLYSKVPRVRREKNNSTGYWEYKPIDLNKEFEDLFKKYGIDEKSSDILSEIKELIKNSEEKLIQRQEFDGKNKNFYERFIYLFNLLLEARNTMSLQAKLDKKSDEIKLEEIDYGIDFFASPVKPFFATAGVRFIGKQTEGGKIQKEKKEEFAIKNFADFERFFKDCSSEGFDSDGVGAYNIARKGIIILERIKQNPKNLDLYISKEDWDNFIIKNAIVK